MLTTLALCAALAGSMPPPCPIQGPDDGPPAKPSPRPHVVLILADDLGIGDLGCYNAETKAPTPNLDALAAQGMRFTDMHSPSAVCTPTRYGLLTGRYCWRSRVRQGVLDGYSAALIEDRRPTLPGDLHTAGYRTGGFGKWHLGLGAGGNQLFDNAADGVPHGPLDVGFDRYFGIPASLDMPPYVWLDDRTVEAPPIATVAGSQHRRSGGNGFWRAGPAAEGFDFDAVLDRTVDTACGWIRDQQAADSEQPLFVYLPLTAPHTPWVPTEAFRGQSGAGHYGDFVMQVDAAVGRVLATLAESGMADNTLLLFTSDNGSHWPVTDIKRTGHHANLGYRGQKADIHEGGHRVPFVARWPGTVPPGSTCGQLLGLNDVYATVLGLLGIARAEGAAPDSRDFSILLAGASTLVPVRDHLIHHSLDGMFAVRAGRWKLIEGLGSGGFTPPKRIEPATDGPTCQLYDLEADPAETVNRAADEPEVVARLQAMLDAVRAADH